MSETCTNLAEPAIAIFTIVSSPPADRPAENELPLQSEAGVAEEFEKASDKFVGVLKSLYA